MVGMGTIANVLAIVVGGCIGLLAKGGLKQHYQDSVIRSLGLATLFIGAGGALCGMLVVKGGGLTDRQHPRHPVYDPLPGPGHPWWENFFDLTARWSGWACG